MAPCQRASRENRCGGRCDVDGAGSLVDGCGEQGERSPGRRGRDRPGGTVEPDDGVKVNDAAALVFGDLGIGDPDLSVQGLGGEPGLAGRVRRRVMVKRRHSSGEQALNRTAPV